MSFLLADNKKSMAKQRLNHYVFYVDYYRYDLWEKYKQDILDTLLDRGFDIEVSHHSIFYFCPLSEDVDFGNYGSSTYQQNHPDWFTNRQARIELPAVQEVIKERYFEYLRRNPELLHRINLLEQVAASGSTAKIQRKAPRGIEKAF